jgi:hypothetical protein
MSGSGEGQHTRARWSLAGCQAADVSVHTKPKIPGSEAHDLHACRSVNPSNLCRHTHAAALPLYESVHIEQRLAFSQIIDGVREHMRQDCPGIA